MRVPDPWELCTDRIVRIKYEKNPFRLLVNHPCFANAGVEAA